jgi:hypothetical protein
MNIEKTNDLLIHIQMIDNRQIGDSTVLAWHELVEDLDFDAALEAVRLHFRESTEYLKPAHIRAGIERIRVSGLGPREDDFGNVIDPDAQALAAHHRLAGLRREVTS